MFVNTKSGSSSVATSFGVNLICILLRICMLGKVCIFLSSEDVLYYRVPTSF